MLGIPLAKINVGLGNQPTDRDAYSKVGLKAKQIFIVNNDTKDTDQLKGKACVFDSYKDLLANEFDGNLSIASCEFPGPTSAVR